MVRSDTDVTADQVIEAHRAVAGRDTELTARADEARRTITECDQRLARYRAALEAGTDPTLIAGWTAEVNATRAVAGAQLRTANTATTRMITNHISTLVAGIGEILTGLRDADPQDEAQIYAGVGLHLAYQPSRQTVITEAKAPAIMYGSSCPRTNNRHQDTTIARHELPLATGEHGRMKILVPASLMRGTSKPAVDG